MSQAPLSPVTVGPAQEGPGRTAERSGEGASGSLLGKDEVLLLLYPPRLCVLVACVAGWVCVCVCVVLLH